MIDESIETAYLAWIAHAKLPADHVRELLLSYETGESVHRAVMNREDRIRAVLAPSASDRLIRTGNADFLDRMRGLITRCHIHAMTVSDPSFPRILEEITDPVSILFCQGNTECLRLRKISMVGSRAASYAGLRAAGNIAADLSRHGIAVVSGFACGIDSASHQGCLKGRSPTIAVMGCGLDQNYPAGNTVLKEQILKNGGLFVSEYAPGERPLAANFPYRNRIISALGEALVLIEARLRSGSLRTVDHALKQGKEVFVYPGDPGSPCFEGNHQLLRDGARYFTCTGDILEDMNWLDNPPPKVQNSDCNPSVETNTAAEGMILGLLKRGEMSFEQIAAESGLPPAELLCLLTMLQIRGLTESLPGKKYALKSNQI